MIFLILGITTNRPIIAVLSGLFVALTLVRRHSARKRMNSARTLWKKFIVEQEELKEHPYRIWKFVENSDYRKDIISRILNEEVTGESFSVDYFEANSQPLPRVGQYNVICDTSEQAYCIVKTVAVIPSRFADVTMALAELEGCHSVQQWRRFNELKYKKLCERMEIVFDEELPLIFEKFEIVYRYK